MSEIDTEEELSVPEEEDGPPYQIGLYLGGRNEKGERHGRGWAILPNGDQYDGLYKNGKRHGMGLYVFKGGARYYGRYRCGHRSGRGMFIYPDGSFFEGNWRKGLRHGKGRYQYVNEDCYTGDWYKGIRHGVGIYIFASDPNCCVRFKGTFRNGIRVGPFEAYFGNSEKCTVLHGTWDFLYPQGPAVFSFDQRYMLLGFFQDPTLVDKTYRIPKRKYGEGEYEGEMEEFTQDDEPELLPSVWFAQDICVYDYAQLPQEPVPLPLSDSDISICSLSTVPTEVTIEKSFVAMGEGEEEEGEVECICEAECEMVECETDSEPCKSSADPCDIDLKAQPTCLD